MSTKLTPVPGSTVRIVTSIATGVPRALYAVCLSVSPILAENLGTDGEPTLSLAFMDDPNYQKLGSADWHGELSRHVGVRHASHSDVELGKVSLFWVDVLPKADRAIDIGSIDEGISEEVLWKLAPAPAPPRTDIPAMPDTNRMAPEPNLSSAPSDRMGTFKVANVQGIPAELKPTDKVEVNGKLVAVGDLHVGDKLDFFGLEVTDVKVVDSILEVSTKTTIPKQEAVGPEQTQGDGSGFQVGTQNIEPVATEPTPADVTAANEAAIAAKQAAYDAEMAKTQEKHDTETSPM